MANTRKPPEFGPAQRLQRSYERGIKAITDRVLTLKKAEQSFEEWLGELVARSRRPDILAASEILARRMISAINIGNQRTWREAAAKSMQSRKLHKLLEAEMAGPTGARVQQLVRENARLISSLSVEAAERLNHEIFTAQQNGARPKTIAKMAQKRFPELLRSRTNLISRTETAKASTALTQARCERLAIEWYQWESSKDKRTRKSHKAMHGIIVPWSQPPSPETLVGEKSQGHYQCGEIYNCRCVVIPILTLDDISFPARIYWNGAVRTMNKQQFKQIAVGMEERTTI